MKLIYILGLEHSGTTLTDHLLSKHQGVLGLGEVAVFFDPAQMSKYMDKWGHCSDVRMCSCDKEWEKCSFWGRSLDLCGLNSDRSRIEKYAILIDATKQSFGDDVVLVASSKSLEVLEMIMANLAAIGLTQRDLVVVYCCKDVRSFAASIAGKVKSNSLMKVLQTFNWWLGANRKMLEFLDRTDVARFISLYESLCQNPDPQITSILKIAGCSSSSAEDGLGDRSHIAMGNKDFALRNRDRVTYDNRWFTNDTVNLAYLIHFAARRFNRNLYKPGMP